jgi:hypothetical protein
MLQPPEYYLNNYVTELIVRNEWYDTCCSYCMQYDVEHATIIAQQEQLLFLASSNELN